MVTLEEKLKGKRDDLNDYEKSRREITNEAWGIGAGIVSFFGMAIADGLNEAASPQTYVTASPFSGIDMVLGIVGASLSAYCAGRLLDYLDDRYRQRKKRIENHLSPQETKVKY